MSDASLPHEVTTWVDAAHARYAGSLLDVMGDAIEVIGIGGPDAAAADLARVAGGRLDPSPDLRRMLIERSAACLLVAVRGGLPPELIQAAADQGTLVVTTEPPAAGLQELAAPWLTRVAPHLLEVPRFDRSLGVEAALDPLVEVTGPPQIRLVSHGRPDEGSLLARLVDAWRTVLRFVEMPENLLAAWSPPPVDVDARAAGGRVAVLARGRDGSTVSLDVAADAARSVRSLRLLGADAQLEIHDGGYERLVLRGEDAAVAVDAAEPPAATAFVDQVAGRWRRHLHHPRAPGPGPGHDAAALACVEAMRLSSRTNQPESPERLLKINGRG
ncbi:hypothetical protein [Phycisphaera mikurensis]|uniref:Oxidoreductase n=1 Tax=Phycisphaera mikurensis (strain NBRC 102666 / KCTC 22515 / FYK2301M01) TaxID=1142394 RepID=I0IDR2_PHYMF|nr:hypothetical protein [Phycisphaera mikurensis]MBB6441215.1 hypothetical protein [Phycisphaera mikurensis]BAM03400.1 hypothetical protein PSMK_12410 [Phycisphaera mikurensis NBRC 102666]